MKQSSSHGCHYDGPSINREDAISIAWQFVQDNRLSAFFRVIGVRHCRPIIYGRPDDKFFGTWQVTFESAEPPDPPDVVTCPAPDSPVLIEVNDQTGEAALFQWM